LKKLYFFAFIPRLKAGAFCNSLGKNAKFPHLEYVYSADIKNINYWQYCQSGESTYPIFHVSLIKNDQKKTIYVIPDTAASLTLIKSEIAENINQIWRF